MLKHDRRDWFTGKLAALTIAFFRSHVSGKSTQAEPKWAAGLVGMGLSLVHLPLTSQKEGKALAE